MLSSASIFPNKLRLQRGWLFGALIITALLAFELFNYSTTDFALADLLGEAWWGVSSAEGLPAARTLGCYTATVPSPKRLLRTIFCFPCTRLRLSTGATIYGEWRRGGAFLSLRTSDVWDFVHFLRYQRRKENLRSEVMEIGGLGDVLV